MRIRKYVKGERVRFRHGGEFITGRITEVLPKVRRIVTDRGSRTLIPVRSLRPARDSVLILEARLDRSLRSKRSPGNTLARMLRTYGTRVFYERVHSREDFARFLHEESKKSPDLRFIHLMAHGTASPRIKHARLKLTFEEIDLWEDADFFAGLDGRILFFSSCEVGSNEKVLMHLLDSSRAQAIYAYTKKVEDPYTNLVELLVYDRLFNTTLAPETIAERVYAAVDSLGIRPEGGYRAKRPIFVCATKRGIFPK